MKTTLRVMLLLLTASVARAYDTGSNPDQFPSLGMDVIRAQAPGILRAGVDGKQTSGALVGFKADMRYPLTNIVTLHAAGESLGIDNNQSFTDSYRMEFGLRVYFK